MIAAHQAVPAELLDHLAALGLTPTACLPLPGDASTRRFFRITLAAGGSLIAALYAGGDEDGARRDAEVQRWALCHGLPVPGLVAAQGRVTVSRDLGSRGLGDEPGGSASGAIEPILQALEAYQRVPWRDAPNPAFDTTRFRNELETFRIHAEKEAGVGSSDLVPFLDSLAESLTEHPYCLVHRDFHAMNLLLSGGHCWTVDFQDLRGGPDTYDLASLLRERGGSRLFPDSDGVLRQAASRLGWRSGWRHRFLECAAQRGLKVIGTFLRLADAGRPHYRSFLPEVGNATVSALRSLGAPTALVGAVADIAGPNGYHTG